MLMCLLFHHSQRKSVDGTKMFAANNASGRHQASIEERSTRGTSLQWSFEIVRHRTDVDGPRLFQDITADDSARCRYWIEVGRCCTWIVDFGLADGSQGGVGAVDGAGVFGQADESGQDVLGRVDDDQLLDLAAEQVDVLRLQQHHAAPALDGALDQHLSP